MGFVVARIEKLKSMSRVSAALRHNLREVQPENADPNRRGLNVVEGHSTTEAALSDLRQQLAEVERSTGRKLRKDAVPAIEYLFTMSPDAKLDQARRLEFLTSCRDFVRKRHGDGRILSSVVHLDETTEHIQIVVAPISRDEETGRLSLSAKRYTSRAALSEFQDIAGELGEPYGLERGIRHSAAVHTSIRQWYARVAAVAPENLKLPTKGPLEGSQAFAERVRAGIIDQVAEPLKRLQSMVDELKLRPTLAYAQTWIDRAKKAEKTNADLITFLTESPAHVVEDWAIQLRERKAASIAQARGRKVAEPKRDQTEIDR